jgi:hypothetical protein
MRLFRFASFVSLVAAFALAPALEAADEAAALAVLASADAGLYAKAMACDELGRVGTAKAVPVLARLLADENLHDYARDGLERIKDPTAGEALLGSLGSLKGEQRIGVMISLGDRREAAAVPALAKIARIQGKNKPVASAALTSLAQIATDEAGTEILRVLAEGFAESKPAAAHAALAAAQQMEKDGRKEAAGKLRKAAAAAGVPAPTPAGVPAPG